MLHRHSAVLAGLLLAIVPQTLRAQSDKEVVKSWLATNSGIDTLRVDFSQVRRLTSLKAPLRQNGVLWLDYRSGDFRWQMGDPPKTVVVKQGDDLLIVRPHERKFERRKAGMGSTPGIAALAKGFPRTFAEFEKKYRLHGVKAREKSFRIMALPRDEASRGVSVFTFVVDAEGYRLQAIEIAFRDGSTQQITFKRVIPKAPFAPGLFRPDLSGYQATKF